MMNSCVLIPRRSSLFSISHSSLLLDPADEPFLIKKGHLDRPIYLELIRKPTLCGKGVEHKPDEEKPGSSQPSSPSEPAGGESD
jgi:hypothetical protein